MTDNPKQEAQPAKKPYSKPKVQQVLLKPEEAVLGTACKTGALVPGGSNGHSSTGGICSLCGHAPYGS